MKVKELINRLSLLDDNLNVLITKPLFTSHEISSIGVDTLHLSHNYVYKFCSIVINDGIADIELNDVVKEIV